MGTDRATAPILARMRQMRGQQEAVVRWLQLLAPLLLALFVLAAFQVAPTPGGTGRQLLVSIAVAAFPVGVLGRNATARHPFGVAHVVFVVLALVSSVVLTWVQPYGPGAVAVLVGVLFAARLLPRRAVVPVLVITFVVLEVSATLTHQDVGSLATLAAFAAFYGLLVLAYRLSEATRHAERLLVELERSQAAQARASGLAERQRLAREMHDVLAHSLSGLILQLEGARMLAAGDPSDPRLPRAIDRAHHLGRTGLDEARRAIETLRDDELPGPERIAALAAAFERDHDVPCRLTVTGDAPPLGSEARLALYRVAQEALTNITKHARPERVELHLAYRPGGARLTVEDVGAGPSPARPDGNGYGLTGMRERAELLGGTLAAGPTDRGFRVELEVPA